MILRQPCQLLHRHSRYPTTYKPTSSFVHASLSSTILSINLKVRSRTPFCSFKRHYTSPSPPRVEAEWRSTLKQLRREVKDAESHQQRIQSLQGSQKVVGLAILSNGIMFSGKLIAAIQSGSASMFSEALHSLADVFNESLLMWGIWRSLREPDSLHPYGYKNEKFAWALNFLVHLVLIRKGIFFLGGGVSLYHGISGLFSSHEMGDLSIAAYALGGSLVFESITLTYAYRHIKRSADLVGVSFLSYLKNGADPTAVQVFLEDCSAITGILIASTCLSISHFFQLPIFDSIGSIAIGLLLSGVASFLIKRNVAGLVETSMSLKKQKEIISILTSDPIVMSVHDVKSTSYGPEWGRFKAEVHFDGEEITKRYLARNPLALVDPRQFSSKKEFETYLIKHGGKVVAALGSEVDRLERRITDKRPEVKHIDLEIL